MKKRDTRPFDAAAYRDADAYLRNRLLLDWLGDPQQRAAFYTHALPDRIFVFPSRAEDEPDTPAHEPAQPPEPLRAHLVLDRELVEEVLRDDGMHFSNLPYARIGSGRFMLALDPAATPAHRLQREVAQHVFCSTALAEISALAVRQASTLALRADAFDLAHLAEQAALRFCSLYFGFAQKDFALLEAAMRAAYAALAYTNLGRHFATDPLVLKAAEPPMGKLALRCAELIDGYALCKPNEWPEPGIQPPELPSYEPVMRKLATAAGRPLTGSQMAVLVVGTLAGTVGNIQAAACIAVDTLLADKDWRTRDAAERKRRCHQAWRDNPPVPFLSRRVRAVPQGWRDLGVREGDELVLALGAALRGAPDYPGDPDPLVFGASARATHGCLGRQLALPLLDALITQVMALPDLARRIDPLLGTPMPLDTRWGFQCTSLPLTHRRQQLRLQQPLNVAMRVKAPIAENAGKLREVLRIAGPHIDQALRQSGMVHFAWFEFNDMDSLLVLHTVYDGDFDAYVEHFALAVGELFDQLFEYIEPSPPRPVSDYPFEFVELIRRFNRPPAAGYFFSAYPVLETQQVLRMQRQQTARPAPPGDGGAV